MSSEHSLNSISLLPSECCEVTQESAIYENSFYEIGNALISCATVDILYIDLIFSQIKF